MIKTIQDIIFYDINLDKNLDKNPNIAKKTINAEKIYNIKQLSTETQRELINTSTHLRAIDDAYKNKYNWIILIDNIDITPLIKHFKQFIKMIKYLSKKEGKNFKSINLLNTNFRQNRESFDNFISFNLPYTKYNKYCDDVNLVLYNRQGIEQLYNDNFSSSIVTIEDKKLEKLNPCHKAGYYIHSQLKTYISNFPYGITDDVIKFHKNFKTDFNFVFIIPLSNNETYIERNINIIKKQSYTNWSIIFINDSSTDDTIKIINKSKIINKYKIINTPFKSFEGYSRYLAYNLCNDEDICIMVNGDDSLQNSNVLELLNEKYKTGIDMTYGNFRTYVGGKYNDSTWIKRYTEKTDIQYNYRKEKNWYGSHLRTYKAKFLKKLNVLDLLDKYFNFFPLNTDRIESFCCLEQTNHYSAIEEVLYKLNIKSTNLLDIDNTVIKKMNKNIIDNIENREKYNKISKNELLLINIQDKKWRDHISQYKYLYQDKYDVLLIPFQYLDEYNFNKYEEVYYLENSKLNHYYDKFNINLINNIDITRIFNINYRLNKQEKDYQDYMGFYTFLFKKYISGITELTEDMKNTMLEYKVQTGLLLQDQRESRLYSLF